MIFSQFLLENKSVFTLNLTITFIFSNIFRGLFGFMIRSCLSIDASTGQSKNCVPFFSLSVSVCSQTAGIQDVHSPSHLRGPESSRQGFRQRNRCFNYTYRKSYRCRWEDKTISITFHLELKSIGIKQIELCQCDLIVHFMKLFFRSPLMTCSQSGANVCQRT